MLVVLAIAAHIAAPAMRGVVVRNQTRSAIDRVAADLAFARMLAVREGRTVSFLVGSGSRYTLVVRRAAGADTVKRVTLAQDYPSVRLSATASELSFNSRGLLQNAAGTQVIRAHVGGSADSVRVLPIGQTYREN